jgi:RND family efflux transporter MFP subunit
MQGKSRLLQILTPLAILLLGVMVMGLLIASRPRPQKQHKENTGVLVEVVEARRSDVTLHLREYGTVSPRHQINLLPQVSGRVEWVSSRLVAGGTFARGDTLLRLEPDDYLLAVQQAQAQVAQAEFQLEMARANADVARQEWQMLNKQGTGSLNATPLKPDPLVLHEPQLHQAEASLQAARASLDRARLNLERTVLTAPFNCRVRSQSVSPGQLVGPNSPLAVLYGTAEAEITVGLPQEELRWLHIPGSAAEIILTLGDDDYRWQGRVSRSVGVMDQVGRLAQVVVTVRDPFSSRGTGEPVLNVGNFVTVEFTGRTLEQVFVLPHRVLHGTDKVWVARDGNTLEVRPVTLVHEDAEQVYLSAGLEEGELVILTPISGAADGLLVRTAPPKNRSGRKIL